MNLDGFIRILEMDGEEQKDQVGEEQRNARVIGRQGKRETQ